ncbi:hypothetical protein [Methanobrevibacter sp.]|uniref:hypothetical protein n=1 Tax=Methanobrevibacter sp. TaxID=66852 RepID=UPI0025E341EB|nr:hypothetical protein [Methanobrevibacter sp.]
METLGVSKTDGNVDTIVHVMNIIAPKATMTPTFMYHRQNLGERLEILDISPLNFWVFHMMTGKLSSTPCVDNLSRNIATNIQMTAKAIK